MSKLFRAVILGPPGSGKGTISKRIVDFLKIEYLASGDALRSQLLQATGLGLQAKQFIDAGKLVPDDIVTQLVLNHLKSFSNANFLLDGFPRTVKQAEILSEEYKISLAINLRVPDVEIIARLKDRLVHVPSGRIYHLKFSPPKVSGRDDITGEELTQRKDDSPEVVKARLQLFRDQNHSIVEFYRNKKVLKEFTGNQTNEIWPKVKEHLEEIYKRQIDM